MAEGWSAGAADDALDTLVAAYPYIQLHTGAPGADGTANVATESTRQDSTGQWAASSGGVVASNADLTWEDVEAQETYSHFTGWDAATDGNFGYSGAITANEIDAGDDFVLEAGDFTVTQPVATTP